MKAGILLITHGDLGEDMLDTVTGILSDCPLSVKPMAIHPDADTDEQFETASNYCKALDQGGGVLVLTDLYGSTPSNIANRLIDKHNVRVLSGVNIPMLLRILNYPDLNLDELSEKAVSGARHGIILSNPE
jgi:PTS system ascorbate-specific IIA component